MIQDEQQLREAAERGDAEAQRELGVRYEEGWGVERDETQAAAWLRKAAEQGDAEAQRRLSDRYYDGRGVGRDAAEAVKWCRAAAEQGDAAAQYELSRFYQYGVGVESDPEEAEKWLRAAAEQGCAKAQGQFGGEYVDHADPKVVAWAIPWIRKAAEQGDEVAQWRLGRCHADGTGVERDDGQAFRWFFKAAKRGFAPAQYELARCYDDGLGVEPDERRAEEWYRAAARDEVTRECEHLDEYYDGDEGDAEDGPRASVACDEALARAGNAAARRAERTIGVSFEIPGTVRDFWDGEFEFYDDIRLPAPARTLAEAYEKTVGLILVCCHKSGLGQLCEDLAFLDDTPFLGGAVLSPDDVYEIPVLDDPYNDPRVTLRARRPDSDRPVFFAGFDAEGWRDRLAALAGYLKIDVVWRGDGGELLRIAAEEKGSPQGYWDFFERDLLGYYDE